MLKSRVLIGTLCVFLLVLLVPVSSAVHHMEGYELQTTMTQNSIENWQDALDDNQDYPLLSNLIIFLLFINLMIGGYIKGEYGVNVYLWLSFALFLYELVGMLLPLVS